MQDNYPAGGIFQASAYNFDPFETMGYLQPSLLPTVIDETKVLQVMNSCVYGFDNNGYIVFAGNRSGTGVKNLYRIKASDQSVTDYSITGGNATGSRSFGGLGFSAGIAGTSSRLLFTDSTNGTIYSMTLAGLTSETALLTQSSYDGTRLMIFHNAPDKNTYFVGQSLAGEVGRIDTITGAGTNTETAFQCDPSLTPKDLTSDGRYEIIIADDNPSNTTGITSNCKVYFWDMDSADPSVVHSIPDSYLIASRFVDGRLLVLGASGIWQTGIGMSPKLVFPLSASQLPQNPYQVTVQNNILHWVSTTSGAKTYAYGAKIGNPIFFSPYQTTGSDNLHTAFISSGIYFYASLTAGTNTTKIYIHNLAGSSRQNTTVETTPKTYSNPFTFSYAKVTLKSKMTSGMSVNLTIYNAGDETIMDTNSQAFSVMGGKKSMKFTANPVAGSVSIFEDMYIKINPVGGAVVQRVAIYGIPMEDSSQII